MRVATWNMSHAVKRDPDRRSNAWFHLRDNVAPDVALVQEAGKPIEGVTSVLEAESDRTWTTAVLGYGRMIQPLPGPIVPTWSGAPAFRIPDIAKSGTLAVALVETAIGPLVAISLYGELKYADQSILRAVSDLIPLMDSKMRKLVILGGDLNIHTHSNSPIERARAKPILDLIEAIGLKNLLRTAKSRGILRQGVQAVLEPCPCDGTDCYHMRTHHHRAAAPGAMANNDYLFASKELENRLQSITAMNGDDDSAWRHSDHCPVVAEFLI